MPGLDETTSGDPLPHAEALARGPCVAAAASATLAAAVVALLPRCLAAAVQRGAQLQPDAWRARQGEVLK